MTTSKLACLLLLPALLLALFQGCGTGPSDPAAPVGTNREAFNFMCSLVPEEFFGIGDGCDCPSDGDTSCDPDCNDSNDGSEYCGCEYCHPSNPPPTGEQCGLVPVQFLDNDDGCDCPANGNRGCDPDCADGNLGGEYCGCQFCYPEEQPPAAEAPYVPPAEGAAFGIPGTPPSAPLNGKANGALVGRVEGGGSVTQDGAYTYSIPVGVPPGRAGMQPTVSLRYNSRAGNGLVGMGWSLAAGQSMISRCGKEYASGYRANTSSARVRQADGITFGTGDPLCLDGQRLELVSGSQGMGGSEYRTEIDQFAKVVALGSSANEPDSFKVYHKNGLVSTYAKHGGTNASGTALTGFFREGSSMPVTLLWAQTLLEDRSGNAIKYTWTNENNPGVEQSMPRLTDIDYTTCTGGGCPYGSGGLHKIQFSYQSRSDNELSYVNGVRIDKKQRLFKIDVYGDSGTSTLNWSYELVFRLSAFTNRSLLERVSQCLGAGCVPHTTFTWQDTGKNTWAVNGLSGERWNMIQPGQSGFTGTEPNATEMSFVVFDADGDGHQDVIAKDWAATALDSTNKLIRDVATLGKGAVDYLVMSNRAGAFQPAQAVDLEGDGHPQASVRCSGGALQGEIADLSSTIAIDLDMDGREELFAPLNTGCPFQFASGATTNGMRITPGLSLVTPSVNTRAQRVFAVLNYDRATSLMKKRATPVPFFNTGFWDSWRYSFGDLTGDGLPEVLFGPGGATDPVTIARASFTGSGEVEAANPEIQYIAFGPTPSGYDTGLRYSWQQQNSSARTPNSIRVLDQNGDGRSEILQLSYDGDQRGFSLNAGLTQAVRSYRTASGNVNWVQAQNLDGTGGTPPNQWPAYPGPNAVSFNGSVMTWRYADLNGDGLDDAVYSKRVSSTEFPWYYRINSGNGYLSEQVLAVTGGASVLWPYGAASEMTISNGVVRIPQDVGLRIADMNGDGRDDFVLLDTPNGSVLYSNGTGLGAPVALPSRGTGVTRISHPGNVMKWPATQLADLDGDGLNDLVEFVVDPSNAKKRVLVTVRRVLPNGYDVMTGVTDGLGAGLAESVAYNSLSDQTFHVSDARFSAGTNGAKICRYPARCVSSGKAVSRYQNFRSSRLIDTSFRYAGARSDVTGRGWLGFREVKATDLVTGVETTSTYEQGSVGNIAVDAYHLYPMLDLPAKTVSLYNGGHDATLAEPDGSAKRLRTTTTWVPTFSPGLPVRTTRVVATTTHADVNSISQSTPFAEDRAKYVSDVQFSNDQYGNVTTRTTSAQDLGALATDVSLPNVTTTRTQTFTYVAADATNWLIGLPSNETVTTTSTNDSVCQGISGCASATRQVAFEYESAARKLLLKVTRQPSGDATQKLVSVLERDAAGLVRRQRVRDGSGSERVSELDFDAGGYHPAKLRNPAGHVSFAQFNRLGLVDRLTDPNGAFVSYTYDTFGRLRRTDTGDGGFEALTPLRAVESSNVVSSLLVTTATGDASKVIFDERGRAILILKPGFNATSGAAPATTTSIAPKYDALGNVVETSFNRLAQAFSAATTATLASLTTAHASGMEITDAGLYDALGRVARTDTGDPNKVAPAEGAGERSSVSYPRFGEVITLKPPQNGVRFETRTITDARGQVRRLYEGNSTGVASRVPVDYTYNTFGTLARVKPASAPAETFTYDALGRISSWAMSGSPNTRTWTYTAFGEVDVATEANAMSIEFVYDRLGRVLSQVKDPSSASTREVYNFRYDTSPRHDANCVQTSGVTLGALAAASGALTEIRNFYDPQGRPCKVRHSFNTNEFTGTMDVGIGYDSAGRANSLRYPNVKLETGVFRSATQPALAIQYQFATNGDLLKVVDTTSTTPVDLYTVTDRHPLGMLKRAVNSGGMANAFQYQTNTLRMKEAAITTAASVARAAQTFAYHESGLLKSRTYGTTAAETYGYASVAQRMTDYTRTGASSAVQVDVDYAYSNAGDITTLTTNTAVAADFGPVGSLAFAYGAGDASGGGTTTTYTDLLTTIDPSTVGASGTISYGYDAAGRQKTKFVGGVKKRTIVGYNAFNLPTQIDVQNGGTLVHRTHFQYDPFGNRTYKRRVTPSASDQSVLYVGGLLEAQKFADTNTAPATQVQRLLCRVHADGQPIAEVFPNADGTKRIQFLYADEQGSVNYRTEGTNTVEASGSAGTQNGFRGFSPYGKRWSAAGADAPLFASIGYTGHRHDDDLGLINMNGRVYDVEQHRFISRDPLVAPYALGGTNAYAYVLGNPTNLTDPSGFHACDELRGPGACEQPQNGGLGDWDGWDEAACRYLNIGCEKKPKQEEYPRGPTGPGGIELARTPTGTNYIPRNCGAFKCPPTKWDPIPPPFGGPPPATGDPVGAPILPPMSGPVFGDHVDDYMAGLEEGPPPPPAAPAPLPNPSASNGSPGTGTSDTGGRSLTPEQQEQWNIVLENAKAVEDLEWELFWAVSGGKAVQWAWTGFRAWQAGRAAAVIATEGNFVYRSVNAVTGQVQYVGITNNLARRAAEHLATRGIHIEKVMSGLSRSDARAVEQALIEIHGLRKNGGTLLNRINSIARTNPSYAAQVRRGHELLQTIGY